MSDIQLSLTARELELCKVVGAMTQEYISQYLDSNPVYEAEWKEIQKESKWAPTLSIIPVTRKTSYGINVRVFQRFRLKGVSNDTFVCYSVFTPNKGNAIFTGIDVCAIDNYTIPRGFFLIKSFIILSNIDDHPDTPKSNPLEASLRLEIKNQKKSKLMRHYNQLNSSFEYRQLGGGYQLKSPRFMAASPVGNKTWIMIHTCANPKKKAKIEYPDPRTGKKRKVNVGVPSGESLLKAIAALGELARYIKEFAVDYEAISKVPEMDNPMPLYLTLEAIRQIKMPNDPPLYFGETTGEIQSERIKTLMNDFLAKIVETSQQDEPESST